MCRIPGHNQEWKDCADNPHDKNNKQENHANERKNDGDDALIDNDNFVMEYDNYTLECIEDDSNYKDKEVVSADIEGSIEEKKERSERSGVGANCVFQLSDSTGNRKNLFRPTIYRKYDQPDQS